MRQTGKLGLSEKVNNSYYNAAEKEWVFIHMGCIEITWALPSSSLPFTSVRMRYVLIFDSAFVCLVMTVYTRPDIFDILWNSPS